MTNDAWTPLRAGRRYEAAACRTPSAPLLAHARRLRSRRRRDAGRSPTGCSRQHPTGARSPSCCSSGRGSSRATASAARGSPAATARSTRELKDLETIGACRRGYFVEGLGGAQFALARRGRAAARAARAEDEPEPLVLAAADPAQPYGAALPWPKRAGRARRPRRRRAGRTARRRGGALRRARRPDARSAARAGRGMAATGDRGARRSTCAAGGAEAARGRAVRRPAGDRDARSCRCSSRRVSSPARAAPCCAPKFRAVPPDHRAVTLTLAQRLGLRPVQLAGTKRSALATARVAAISFLVLATLTLVAAAAVGDLDGPVLVAVAASVLLSVTIISWY